MVFIMATNMRGKNNNCHIMNQTKDNSMRYVNDDYLERL